MRLFVRNFHQTPPDMPLEYCFLSGQYTEQYLHDMRICQEYADENRKMIARRIVEAYGFEAQEHLLQCITILIMTAI